MTEAKQKDPSDVSPTSSSRPVGEGRLQGSVPSTSLTVGEQRALLELFERARFELVENYPRTERETSIAFHQLRRHVLAVEKAMEQAAPIFGKG